LASKDRKSFTKIGLLSILSTAEFKGMFALLPLIFLLLFGCRENNTYDRTVRITEPGVLDLRGIDIEQLDMFALSGEWHAYPGELPVSQEEFIALDQKTPIPLAIPGYWINQNLPAEGFVTYKLKLISESQGNLMIYLKEASSAYKIFALSKERGLVELGSSGKLSTTKEESIGYYTESARAFRLYPDTTLYLQVSNYLYSRGGPYYSPYMGGAKKTLIALRNKERKKMFFVGTFFVLFIYHLILFIHRMKDKFTLFYALICLSWLIRYLLFERLTRDWFEPSDTMEMIQIRIEYLAFIVLEICSLNFFYQFFNTVVQKKVIYYYLVVPFLLLIITLFSPYFVYTKFLFFTQGYMVVLLLYSLFFVIRFLKTSERDKHYVGLVFLLATLTILFTTIYDSLVFFSRSTLPLISEYGFCFYSLCLAAAIASRNSYAWETTEYLTLNLQNEIDWKTIELKREKEKAEKASELKDKFISIVSHDIRSPLFGISSVVDLLTSNPPSLSPTKAKQVLGEASQVLKSVLFMVEELIQYSRFQNTTIFPDYQLFEFSNLVLSVKEKAKPLLDAKRISLDLTMNEVNVGIGDPHLIEHLIWNLLNNAIKYSPMEGRIQISILENEGYWIFRVSDHGIGFPESWTEKIFEEGFLYLRKGTAGEIGAGIGLAFSREVAERHGGSLSAEVRDREGATFTFKLPNFDKVVMILDDNPGYRKTLRKLLEGLPCVIWEEEYPDHALSSIPKLKPDLIILDFSMPEKNGLQVLQELYANGDFLDIKSLLLSSSMTDIHTGNQLEMELKKIGGDSFLRKTVSNEKMLHEIKKLLEIS